MIYIDLETNEVTQLGEMYEGYDIKAMAIHRETNIIYVASGNNTSNGHPKGHLYMLDAETGFEAKVDLYRRDWL